ncbi:MAG: hypothetical protein ACOY5R_22195 [Pseudomonadota bacterium]
MSATASRAGLPVGALSLALGVTDIVLAKRFARGVGLNEPNGSRIFRGAGLREVATGIAALAYPRSRRPIEARLLGDVMDLALLASVAARPGPRRQMAAFAVGIVAAVTCVDIFARRRLKTTDTATSAEVAEPPFGMKIN